MVNFKFVEIFCSQTTIVWRS